jgi:hypothetical protein
LRDVSEGKNASTKHPHRERSAIGPRAELEKEAKRAVEKRNGGKNKDPGGKVTYEVRRAARELPK